MDAPAQPGALRRISLVAQAAEAIRQGLDRQAWDRQLPGARQLAETFHVSRPTVEAALRLLAREGRLETRPRRRCRVVQRRRARPEAPGRLVCIVSHEPFAETSFTANLGISELRAHLAQKGFAMEIVLCPRQPTADQWKKLRLALRQRRTCACLLLSVSRECQRWFAASPWPALIFGSAYGGIPLPSLDLDYRSLCRHAAGRLFAAGHRRIALVVPDSQLAGELASERGFREALAARPRSDQQALVVRHRETARSLRDQLDGLFRGPRPPTGLVVAKPAHVLSVLIYLLRRGHPVPGAISLIARDWDHSFRTVTPALAHYAFDEAAFIRRFTRLVLQMVNQGYLAQAENLLQPQFLREETVAPPPRLSQ
jgi:DNA-binding LacI/PurR family transcriptional regulator